MDDCKWSEKRYNEIKKGVSPFLKSCGYNLERDIHFLPVSGLTGDNFIEPSKHFNWYKGPSFVQILNDLKIPKRKADDPLRVPILDKMQDQGTILFGKVESGTMEVGDQLCIQPNEIPCQVEKIWNCKEELVPHACPGENVKMRIKINEENEININRGSIVGEMENRPAVTQMFEAKL